MSVMYVNGRDVGDMGWRVTGLDPWVSGLEIERQAPGMPGRSGSAPSDVEIARPRPLRVTLLRTDLTVATRDAALTTLADALRGDVEIRFRDQASKYVMCRLEGMPVRAVVEDYAFGIPHIAVELEMVAYQPAKLDTTESVTVFDSTTPGEVQVGTERHWGVIFLCGSPSAPEITVTNFRGIEVASLTLTGSLTAAQVWEVHLYDGAVYLHSAGARTRVNVVSAGDFWAFDPAWADRANSIWPKISTTSGEGVLYHRPRWSN